MCGTVEGVIFQADKLCLQVRGIVRVESVDIDMRVMDDAGKAEGQNLDGVRADPAEAAFEIRARAGPGQPCQIQHGQGTGDGGPVRVRATVLSRLGDAPQGVRFVDVCEWGAVHTPGVMHQVLTASSLFQARHVAARQERPPGAVRPLEVA